MWRDNKKGTYSILFIFQVHVQYKQILLLYFLYTYSKYTHSNIFSK